MTKDKEQTKNALVHLENHGLTKRSAGLVRRGLESVSLLDEQYSNLLAQETREATIQRMRELTIAPLYDIILSTQFEVTQDGVLTGNAEFEELLRRTREEVDVKEDRRIRGSENIAPGFKAIFIEPNLVNKMVEVLNQKASDMEKIDYYTKEEILTVKRLAAALRTESKKAAAQGTIVAYINVFNEGLLRGMFQRASYFGAKQKDLAARHKYYADLAEDSLLKTAYDNYFHARYDWNKQRDILIEETASELAASNHSELGLTLEEANQFLRLWFLSYVRQNGLESLEHFSDDLPHLNPVIQQIRQDMEGELPPEEIENRKLKLIQLAKGAPDQETLKKQIRQLMQEWVKERENRLKNE